MPFFTPSSRFGEFKEDFLKDTGKKADENMELYTQYVTARFADMNHRIISNMSNELQELQKVLKKV